MKIKFYKPEELEKNLKVTIHKTGKMGFTMDAAKKLLLPEMNTSDIGSNEEDEKDECLYLAIYKGNEGGFKVSKAGQYYYINTKVLFDNLKVDYSKGNIVYDMSEIEIDGTTYYKLKRRRKEDKNKTAE